VPVLQHDFRRLRIEFAPASFRPGVLYQYRLEPADGEWSRWTGEPFIDYTNLAPGHHTFHLRDRGVEAVSEETRWLFRVRTPWYRTAWAVALWLLAGVAVVMGIVMLRTRSLRVQAERLRQKIAERTDELRKTVDQLSDAQRALVQKNELLQQSNGRLERLSMLDELTGIANRRYFQRALFEDWERARESEQPLALILLDLDRFKDLNDAAAIPREMPVCAAWAAFWRSRCAARPARPGWMSWPAMEGRSSHFSSPTPRWRGQWRSPRRCAPASSGWLCGLADTPRCASRRAVEWPP
jgi:hypothetical protein